LGFVNLGLGIRDLGFGIWDSGFGIRLLVIWDLGFAPSPLAQAFRLCPSSRAIASRGLPLLLYNTISSQSKY